MKTTKLGLLFVALLTGISSIGQIILDFPFPTHRTQTLNQYTSVFISSPKNGTILQTVRNQSHLKTLNL